MRGNLCVTVVLVFVTLYIVAPVGGNAPLLACGGVLGVLRRTSPEVFLTLNITKLVLLAKASLSIKQVINVNVAATAVVVRRNVGANSMFNRVFSFAKMPANTEIIVTLLTYVILYAFFADVTKFFATGFGVRPFVSAVTGVLIVFNVMACTAGKISFNTVRPIVPGVVVPGMGNFPAVVV